MSPLTNIYALKENTMHVVDDKSLCSSIMYNCPPLQFVDIWGHAPDYKRTSAHWPIRKKQLLLIDQSEKNNFCSLTNQKKTTSAHWPITNVCALTNNELLLIDQSEKNEPLLNLNLNTIVVLSNLIFIRRDISHWPIRKNDLQLTDQSDVEQPKRADPIASWMVSGVHSITYMGVFQ